MSACREEFIRQYEERQLADRAWIKANPGRRFHLRESAPGESGYTNGCYRGLDLLACTLVKIAEDRRGWSSRHIFVVAGPVIDTDEAAAHALDEHDKFIMPSLMTRAYFRSWSASRLGNRP